MAYTDKTTSEYFKEYYENNKQDILQRNLANTRRAIERNRQFVKTYLMSHPCIDCGNSDIRVLEFDHVRGIKIANISDLTKKSYSINKIEEEISKCEVRCANCHRIVTHERRDIE